MIFDTHCHLALPDAPDQRQRAEHPNAVIQRARNHGIAHMLTVGIDLPTSIAARELSRSIERRDGGVHYAAGLHPNRADRLADEFAGIRDICREADCLAVGETGLDFYWDRTTPEQQAESLAAHLALAADVHKPIIIHTRDAFPETMALLAERPDVTGVIHCFSGDVDDARAALDLGYYISFAGPLTYPRSDALRKAAAFVPEDRILVETDAPFLAPQAVRGSTNEPAHIVHTVRKLAEIRGIEMARAADLTLRNARRLFFADAD